MKIAFVSICGMPWGGSEILWVATAKEALLQRHEVLVSVFDWPEQHPAIKELQTLGATFIYRKRFYPAFLKRLKKKIINKFRAADNKATYHDYLIDFKADHILFSLSGGDEIAQDSSDLMIFIKQTQIPFSVFYHSLNVQVKYTANVRDNFKLLLQKAANNFFTSKMQIDLMEMQLQFHHIKKASILNHPLRNIQSFPLLLNEGESIKFCIIGNLVSRWKGQDLVMKILANEKWLIRNWVLNLFGKGEDEFYFKELAIQLGISKHILFHNITNDIENVFKENHLVLIPSRKDSGPIVLFEAMLAARPVVGSYMGAMPDYIVSEETGVLAKGISENDFEEALETAWINRLKWQTWGLNGKKMLECKYDFQPVNTLLNYLCSN